MKINSQKPNRSLAVLNCPKLPGQEQMPTTAEQSDRANLFPRADQASADIEKGINNGSTFRANQTHRNRSALLPDLFITAHGV